MKITLDLEEKIIEIEGQMNFDKLLVELEKMEIDYTEWEIKNKDYLKPISYFSGTYPSQPIVTCNPL